MYKLPWKTKGIVLTAPQPYKNEIPDVARFIEETLAPAGVNLIVLQIRYRYQFKRHPECQGFDPLSENDIKILLDVCRRNNIHLVPKMNLFGHQSGIHNTPTDGILHGLPPGKRDDFPDALLRSYPFLEEEIPDGADLYARHICPRHPLLPSILFDLIDELLDVFEADAMHIGCDEVFGIGECSRCKGTDIGEIFACYVNMICEHLKSRGARTMIWSDRLLDSQKSGYNNIYESSSKGADSAIRLLNKDVICCDWHYEVYDSYKSVDIFAENGFNMMISPWNNTEATGRFLNYATENDKGHILGYLQTTWCSSGELARYFLYGTQPQWEKTPSLLQVLKEYFL